MMTTNYTRILNDNLDMFYTEDEYEYSNGIGWDETEDGMEYADEYTSNEELWEELRELRADMETVIDRCGVYGAEIWAGLAAQYSDCYKELFGSRPSDYGLRYHFMR